MTDITKETTSTDASKLISIVRELSQSTGLTDTNQNLELSLRSSFESDQATQLIDLVSRFDVYAPELSESLHAADAIDAISPLRRLRTVLNMPLRLATAQIGQTIKDFDEKAAQVWTGMSDQLADSDLGQIRLLDFYLSGDRFL